MDTITTLSLEDFLVDVFAVFGDLHVKSYVFFMMWNCGLTPISSMTVNNPSEIAIKTAFPAYRQASKTAGLKVRTKASSLLHWTV